MGALQKGHSIFESGIQGLKSKVDLNDKGQDVSRHQYETAAHANIDSAVREQKIVKRVNWIIDQIAETKSLEGTEIERFARKVVNEQSPKEVLRESIILARNEIRILEKINPEQADQLYEDLALAIIDNENISIWQEELLSNLGKKQ